MEIYDGPIPPPIDEIFNEANKTTKKECREILKDKTAIEKMFGVDGTSFVMKKYHSILARNPESWARGMADDWSRLPYTEAEKRYLASPENAMGLDGYLKAHPEEGEAE